MRVRPVEFAVLGSLFAASAGAAEVQISDAWIRALPPPAPSGGYFTLRNTGKLEISLIGAKSGACGMLMLHRSKEMGGMSSMEDVSSVPVPTGGEIRFMPGGYHLMCMDPTRAITPGASVPVTLQFSDKMEATANFTVKNAQGK
jgi:periplasmic copper chaperone A